MTNELKNILEQSSKLSLDSSAEEIEEMIKLLQGLSSTADNMQMALKIFLNSAYGVMANEYFMFYNPNVAEAVTLQGQDLIKSTASMISKYYHEKWHLDKDIHKKLGIDSKTVKKIDSSVPAVAYIDTDSNFFSIQPLIDSCDYKGSSLDFMMKFDEGRLEKLFNSWHEIYASKFHVKNLQEFEFEKFCDSGIWTSKKHYSLDLIYKDGIKYDPLTKIDYTGIIISRGDTPPFAKEKLIIFLTYLFKNKGKVDYNNVINLVIGWKKEYDKNEVNKISYLKGITDYEKYVISDSAGAPLQLASRTPIQTRAAANYNYYLNNHPELKQKYELIKSGDKVRFYYSKPDNNFHDDVFGFINNEFPYTFAPEVDYRTMFSKSITDQVNIFLTALGAKNIPENLIKLKRLM